MVPTVDLDRELGHSVRYAIEPGGITGDVPVDYEGNALVAGVSTFAVELVTAVVEGHASFALPSGLHRLL